MISEELQDQAALYALNSLDAAETAAFERELSVNAELRALVSQLRETAAMIALSAPQEPQPSPAVKARVMEQIAGETRPTGSANVIKPHPSAFRTWAPWAIAAALALFCGLLALDRAELRKRLSAQTETAPILVALAPTDTAPAQATAVVAWQPERQQGLIKISHLPAPEPGKDYQLWAVDAAHKDPVNAGVVRVSADGIAEIRFQPMEPARHVQAFAISLEREGGVPKKEGPILLVGKI